MRVLVVTGDKTFGPGHPRYELQRSAVEQLYVVYWGRGVLWPKLPSERCDVVTVQDPFWRGVVAWFVARRLGARFNVQVHADLMGQSLAKHIVAQMVLRHADSVRVVSEKIKHQVEKIGVRARVVVLPVFVELERFTHVVRQPEKTILRVGRFEAEKDPMHALEVAQSVGVPLVMLGKGSLEPRLRAEISRLNLDTNVTFMGWQDPLPYLARAGVVLCTSKHESFGVSIIEALAAGVPVVAPDVGVAKEAGATVVPRNKLAEAVVTVLAEGSQGRLQLSLPSKTEWIHVWQKSLS